MKAKKKEILEISADDLQVDYKPRLKVVKVVKPKERGGNVTMFTDAAELIKTLKDREGIIK